MTDAVLLVDVANVMGSRPDGWWRDRRAAAARLLTALNAVIGTDAVDPDGRRLFDAELPQDETRLRELLSRLSEHGQVLVVVDQPNTIGAKLAPPMISFISPSLTWP